MDSFWQQHRSFILKILAGVFVVLVCWIIGSSLHEKALSDRITENQGRADALKRRTAPNPARLAQFGSAVGDLEERVRSVSGSLGLTVRPGDSDPERAFRREVIGRIVRAIDPGIETRPREFESKVEDLLARAVSNPIGCVVGLRGEAKEYLLREAARRNIRVIQDLGFGRDSLEADQIDRYLVALSAIVKVVDLVITEELSEIAAIQIRSPVEIEAELGSGEMDEYGSEEKSVFRLGTRFPVSFTVGAPSADLLRFLGKLVEPTPGTGQGWGSLAAGSEVPPGLVAFRELSNLRRSSRVRRENEDLMEATFVVAVLKLDLDLEGED